MSKTNYRVLVIATIALPLLGLAAEWIFGLIPEELSTTYYQRVLATELGVKDLVTGLVAIALLLGLICGSYGLLRFRNWAPRLNVWLTAVALVLTLFAGPVLQSAFASALATLSSMLYGWILSMAFYSPEVREWFSSNGD